MIRRLPGVAAVRPVIHYRLTLEETVPYVGATAVHERGFEGEGVWVPGKGSTRFLLLTEAPSPSLAISLSNGPEGNVVEFSYDQGVYAKANEVWGDNSGAGAS